MEDALAREPQNYQGHLDGRLEVRSIDIRTVADPRSVPHRSGPAAGRNRLAPADGVRQRRRVAAGPRYRPRKGNRGSARGRRQPWTDRSPVAHRESAPDVHRRRRRRSRGAYATMPLLVRWLPPARGIGLDPAELRTLSLDLHPDFRVVAFSIAVCALTAVLSAFAPAWRSSRHDLYLALKTTISDARHRRFQSVAVRDSSGTLHGAADVRRPDDAQPVQPAQPQYRVSIAITSSFFPSIRTFAAMTASRIGRSKIAWSKARELCPA